jgi:nitronate monooxygenase
LRKAEEAKATPNGRREVSLRQRRRSALAAWERCGSDLGVQIARNYDARMWPDRRLIELFGIEHPLVQAPMAGVQDWELAVAVSEAGGLGSLACAMLNAEKTRDEVAKIRARTKKPFNLNFFCHTPPRFDNAREAAWRDRLAPYYGEHGLDPNAPSKAATRKPFDAELCDAVIELKPKVVSFQFGLPEPKLFQRVKDLGCVVLGCATTVAEAKWLAARGVDAIISQGFEAGGHRGNFLSDDMSTQVGTLTLVPQIADAVRVPVIAAGGITDARAIAAAFALGAAGVQMGTAFLLSPEARSTAPHRAAVKAARDDGTTITNVFTGRPARGFVNRLIRDQGPMADGLPEFPLPAVALAPLRAKAEAEGKGDFSPLWAGEAAAFARELPAAEILRQLAQEALTRMRELPQPAKK